MFKGNCVSDPWHVPGGFNLNALSVHSFNCYPILCRRIIFPSVIWPEKSPRYNSFSKWLMTGRHQVRAQIPVQAPGPQLMGPFKHHTWQPSSCSETRQGGILQHGSWLHSSVVQECPGRSALWSLQNGDKALKAACVSVSVQITNPLWLFTLRTLQGQSSIRNIQCVLYDYLLRILRCFYWGRFFCFPVWR